MLTKGSRRGGSLWLGWRVAVCLSLLFAVCPSIALAVPALHPESIDDPAARTCHSHTFELLTPDELPSDGAIGVIPDDIGDMPLQAVSEGEVDTETYIPLVMISIGFEGQPYDDTHDWHDIIYNGNRSLSQYYKDMSCGKFTYKKKSGSKRLTVNKKTGKVTVKKGTKKGTYKIKVEVMAAGNANYLASKAKTVTVKVKVK